MESHNDETLNYLYGRGDPAARKAFEARVAAEPKLRAELDAERALNRSLNNAGKLAPREDALDRVWALINRDAGLPTGQYSVSITRPWWQRYLIAEIAAAASLFLAIGILWWGGVFSSAPEPEPGTSNPPVVATNPPDEDEAAELKLLAAPPFDDQLFARIVDRMSRRDGLEMAVDPKLAQHTGLNETEEWVTLAKGLEY